MTHIYVDGSRTTTSRFTGAAVVIPHLNLIERYSLPKLCSSFTAELFAIRQALLLTNLYKFTEVIIFSDSDSAISAIPFNGWKPKEFWLLQNIRSILNSCLESNCTVHITWLPSHKNIPGNDQADDAAKYAAIYGDRIYNLAVPVQDLVSQIIITLNNQNIDFEQNSPITQSHYFKYCSSYHSSPWFRKHFYTRAEIAMTVRLRTNHLLTACSKRKMQLSETDLCQCGTARETANHIFFACPLYEDARCRMLHNLRRFGHQFPLNIASLVAYPNPPTIRELQRYLSRIKMKI